MSKFTLDNQTSASVSTPASGKTSVFVDSADKHLKSKDDAGSVIDFGAPGNAITALTGEVTATGPGSAAATVTNASVIAKVLTGYVASSGTITAADSILTAIQKIGSRFIAAWFGNGADGDITISVDTTLTRDMYYNSLTVNLGVTLFTAGFRVVVANDCNILGSVDRSGNDATSSVGAVALAAGTLGLSGAGGAGGTAAGTIGGAVGTSIGASGGAGGLGSGGAGGGLGLSTVPTALVGGVDSLNQARQNTVAKDLTNVIMTGGGGGGGGGGDGTAAGGGGSGAGVIVLSCRNLIGNGTIRAQGGDGFQPTAGNRGGGGGGGGGAVLILSENDTTAGSLVINVSGGLGASGFGTGVAGSNGSTGRIVRVRV